MTCNFVAKRGLATRGSGAVRGATRSVGARLVALVLLAALAWLQPLAAQGLPPVASDEAIVAAQDAFRKGNGARLAQLLPRAQGHLLEPWVAYWVATSRIGPGVPFDEFRAFARQWPGSYVTDRLRNDWLLELGRRREWPAFAEAHAEFVMRDDANVDCWELLRRHAAGEDVAAEAFAQWMKIRDGEACHVLGETLLAAGKLGAQQAWERVRRAFEQERPKTAARAAAALPEAARSALPQIYDNALRWLAKHPQTATVTQRQLAVLAVARIARSVPDSAAQWLAEHGSELSEADRAYLWGQIGRSAALNLDAEAVRWFANTGRARLSDEVLAWKVRAALRAQDWPQVLAAVPLMSDEQLRDPAWTYWHARAQAASGKPEVAQELLRAIASPFHFYGQLALEDLGQKIALPPPPQPPISSDEVEAARARPGIARALKLFALGLRSEAVREWNFTLRGMSDRELLATAEVGCQAQLWDRCVNTSDRTRELVDVRQRYAMPFRDAIKSGAQAAGLEEAYVFGLIRQESRFITDARSSVGAGGLMQLMPATARWTAKKIGVDLTPGVNDVGTNVALGTAYLRMLKDEFDGHEALAAAGYNAGPGRPRKWRTMGVGRAAVEAAVFAENVPFNETRDYVKRVLSNATVYAALISGQPQSLKARLQAVAARGMALPNRDLP